MSNLKRCTVNGNPAVIDTVENKFSYIEKTDRILETEQGIVATVDEKTGKVVPFMWLPVIDIDAVVIERSLDFPIP